MKATFYSITNLMCSLICLVLCCVGITVTLLAFVLSCVVSTLNMIDDGLRDLQKYISEEES